MWLDTSWMPDQNLTGLLFGKSRKPIDTEILPVPLAAVSMQKF